jgi:hypothetical protein
MKNFIFGFLICFLGLGGVLVYNNKDSVGMYYCYFGHKCRNYLEKVINESALNEVAR